MAIAWVQEWRVSRKGKDPYTEYSFHLDCPDREKIQGQKIAHQAIGDPVETRISNKDYLALRQLKWVWSFDPNKIVAVQ
jgi:hypothetical protein